MDIGNITAAVNSLKVAGDIARSLFNLHTAAEVGAKASELNRQIIDAQQQVFAANAAQTALLERVRELEGQLERMKAWDAQKQRYALAAPFAGCMVYALKKERSDGEPPHYLCTACFQRGERSILQGKERLKGSFNSVYFCPRAECHAEAETKYGDVPVPQYFEDIKAKQ